MKSSNNQVRFKVQVRLKYMSPFKSDISVKELKLNRINSILLTTLSFNYILKCMSKAEGDEHSAYDPLEYCTFTFYL